ncbi:C40 family peptidase [Aestuariibius sp. 2305UL40-4]|uniref:C40 family peptidase n=1 Tax=Aestuariibius violaceus TaxID=3234132 RepID=UPI00345EEA28
MSEDPRRLDLGPGEARRAMRLTDICRSPEGARDRQLQRGEAVSAHAARDGWMQVTAGRDGYTGWVLSDDLHKAPATTHRVAVRATHAYPEPNMKTRELASYGFGTELAVVDERHKFFETDAGFVPKAHLRPLDRPFSDPVTVAQLFFGTPYLWGGNSVFGLDCSGITQIACLACGLPCPGDSDMQEAELGQPTEDLRHGDLIFWKGHVAWVVDEQTILHANAHHMAVAYEPLGPAIARIEAQGDGKPTARKRL